MRCERECCLLVRFKERMPSLIGVVGTTFMAVFITISSAIFAPVQCERHPNGYQTVQDYPQIICWSSDYENGDKHTSMVVLSCIASVVPFSFVTVCVWIVMQLPVRMAKGDTAFLHTFSFLFFRFQPSAYWYVLVLLARNLAAATVPVILDEALQLLCLATVLGPCVVVCARALPWRISVGNMLDTTVNMGLLLIVFLAALHAEILNESLIADMLVVVFVSICTLFALVFLKAVFKAILLRGKKFQFFFMPPQTGRGWLHSLVEMPSETAPTSETPGVPRCGRSGGLKSFVWPRRERHRHLGCDMHLGDPRATLVRGRDDDSSFARHGHRAGGAALFHVAHGQFLHQICLTRPRHL